MDYAFEVGTSERHSVDIHYRKLWSRIRISVDDQVVVAKSHLVRTRCSSVYTLNVGRIEPHHVVVRRSRPAGHDTRDMAHSFDIVVDHVKVHEFTA